MYSESKREENKKEKGEREEEERRRLRRGVKGTRGIELERRGKRRKKEDGTRSGTFHHLQGRPLSTALEYSVSCYLKGMI